MTGRRRLHTSAGRSWLVGAAAALVAVGLGACGGTSRNPGVARLSAGVARTQVVEHVPLAGGVTYRLPGTSWATSFDVRLPLGSRLALALGNAAVTVSGVGPVLSVALPDGGSHRITRPAGWRDGGWWHVEATNTRLMIDGRPVALRPASGTVVSFRTEAGRPQVGALIVTDASERGLMLLHRLAELHARIPVRRFPVGATVSDRIVYGSNYWTSGFWAGALWQAAAIAPRSGLFAHWALTATLEHFGQERADTHDVGFMYGESSLAAWDALCRGQSAPLAGACARLKRSVLAAATELRTLAASNQGAGTIPTNASSIAADTIIDSMMNIAILPWASRVTGEPAYDRLARHHAHVIARVLVRRDGSTAQAVYFDRRTGRVLSIGTHQGLSDSSTWSRGEGWALYGFAEAAADLHDRGLLRVAVTVADFVASHLPAGAIPLWDYDASPRAPIDVSAGVITAAGLFHLASACRELAGVCSREAPRWSALGRRMLVAALGRASVEPPLGFLGSQVLNERGHGCWCNGGELIFGLTYALEALQLEHTAGP